MSLVFTLGSCSQSEENNEIENSIYGTWQLIERKAGNVDGTPNDWESISNGYKITFNENSSYESEIEPSNCNEVSSSVYNLRNESEINILEITILCVDPNTTFESKDSYIIEDATFLILTPIEPECFEGCAFKYKKIK